MAVKNQIRKQVTNADGNQAQVVTRTPLLDQGDIDEKRQEILQYFHDSFTLYELSLIHISEPTRPY